MQEQERILLLNGECFPGLKRDDVQERTDADSSASDSSGTTAAAAPPATPAYQKYYFYLQGPLVSPFVKFSEKKSIIGDDDDD